MMKKTIATTLTLFALMILCSCTTNDSQSTDAQSDSNMETQSNFDTSVDTDDKDYGWSKDYI